ncbi:MAG: hypothetical protein ROY99_00270 [Ignavibacterium sp.]|jgi:hypothetical protein|nr:hypothetical protein [Ignavibacterium sp.]
MIQTREQLIAQKKIQLKVIDLALGILVGLLYGYAIDNLIVGLIIGIGVGFFKWINSILFWGLFFLTIVYWFIIIFIK